VYKRHLTRFVSMRHEYRPHPEEAAFFRGYTSELRESFQSGLLKELTPYPHFVVWRYRVVDGAFKKPPFNPKSFYPAQVDNPNTWGTLRQALAALSTGNFHGIGFVFSEDDPFTGIDLDDCVAKDGYIYSWARKIIDSLHSYTEYSPGKGVHLLLKASLKEAGRKIGDIEMYAQRHYMTLTTRHVEGTPTTINERQELLNALYHTLVPPPPRTQNTGGVASPLWAPRPQSPEPTKLEKPDEQVIKDGLREERSNFARYWNGDQRLLLPQSSGAKPERKSESEVLFVLVAMLLTRTGDNTEQVKRLYWQSPFSATYPKAAEKVGTDAATGEDITYLDLAIYNVLKKRNEPQRR